MKNNWMILLIGILLWPAYGRAQDIAKNTAEKISVASFNTWGVPFAVWDTWRYAAAMKALEKLSPDLILLEEVFSAKGNHAYRSAKYPYEVKGPKWFPRVVGSGVRILSKYPIERKATLVYRSCEKDDCLSRKGAVMAVVDLPSGQKLNVIATHLNARGDDPIREDQIDQLLEFISYYAEPNAPILLGGDFNFNPSAGAYSYLIQRVKALNPDPLTDLWVQTHSPDDPGYTNDSVNDPYAREYNERTNFPLTQERIDYQFTTKIGNGPTLVPDASHLFFNEAPYYSDHYALWGEYHLQ